MSAHSFYLVNGAFTPNGIDAYSVSGVAIDAIVQTGGAQNVGGIKTFSGTLKVTAKIVIPLAAPASLENGCIWIEP